MVARKSVRISAPEDMGRLIYERRRELGMTQEELASVTGIAQPNLSTIEKGKTAALKTYLSLLTALGVDLVGVAR